MHDVVDHVPGLRRYARSLTLDAEAADDLVQQTLLRAIERSGSFRAGAPLRPWLFSILHNLFVSDRRREGVERRALDQLAGEQAVLSDAGDAGAQVRLNAVMARFDQLPAVQREVLHLIAVEGLSYQEASDALGVPIGTIMSRLSRARTGLREAPARGPGLRLIGGNDV
jgi:RNA polymerase sigma-70 factor (ECF subfamily)